MYYAGVTPTRGGPGWAARGARAGAFLVGSGDRFSLGAAAAMMSPDDAMDGVFAWVEGERTAG